MFTQNHTGYDFYEVVNSRCGVVTMLMTGMSVCRYFLSTSRRKCLREV